MKLVLSRKCVLGSSEVLGGFYGAAVERPFTEIVSCEAVIAELPIRISCAQVDACGAVIAHANRDDGAHVGGFRA
jgi:hypothetical protein